MTRKSLSCAFSMARAKDEKASVEMSMSPEACAVTICGVPAKWIGSSTYDLP